MKKWRWFAFLMVLLVSQVCEAGISSEEDMAIGGIGLGATMAYTESIYGKPTSVQDVPYKSLKDGKVYKEIICKYGEAYSVKYIYGNRQSAIVELYSRDASLGTPDGVVVGMDASVLTNLYGRADRINLQGEDTVFEYHLGRERLIFNVYQGRIKLLHLCYLDSSTPEQALESDS